VSASGRQQVQDELDRPVYPPIETPASTAGAKLPFALQAGF